MSIYNVMPIFSFISIIDVIIADVLNLFYSFIYSFGIASVYLSSMDLMDSVETCVESVERKGWKRGREREKEKR